MKLPKKQTGRIGDQFNFRKLSVITDVADKELFIVAKSTSTKLNDQDQRLAKKKYKPISELQEDVFAALFKYAPRLAPEADMDPEYMLNRMVLREGMQSTQYQKLRITTALDDIASLVGTEVMMEQLEDLLEQKQEELEKLQQEGASLEEALQALEDGDQEAAQKAMAGITPAEDGDKEGQAKKKYTLEEVKKQLEENEKKQKQILSPADRRQVKAAMGKAERAAEEMSDFITNWGLGGDQTLQKKPYKEKIKIIEKLRNNQKLKRLAYILGKIRPLSLKMAKEQVKKIPSRIQDMVLTSDPSKALASDLAKLHDPHRKIEFYKDMVEGKLLRYDYSGNRKKGKGPIVCCIDSSGSMDSNDKELWSKAIAMGLLEIARSQKRDMVFIQFDDSNKEGCLVDVFEKENPWDVDKIISFAESFLGGGTRFEPPLELSREYIDKVPQFVKADIVFITDGESAVRDAFLHDFIAWRDKKKVFLQTILLDAGSYTSKAVEEFSTKIIKLSSLNVNNEEAIEAAKDIFGQVL